MILSIHVEMKTIITIVLNCVLLIDLVKVGTSLSNTSLSPWYT